MTLIDIKLLFVRDIAEDGTLTAFEGLLRGRAATWCQTMRIWTSNREQTPIQQGRLRAEIIGHVTHDGPVSPLVTRTMSVEERRRVGTSEVRGTSPDLTVVIRVDAFPYSRRGGEPAMNNSLAVQVRRPKVAGRPAAQWSADFFAETCAATNPLWGTVNTWSEYDQKVMNDGPGTWAEGRNFDKYLPGLFAHNYFGPPYVDLIGQDALLSAPAAETRKIGDGVLLVVEPDPDRWDTPQAISRNQTILDHLGREHFYDKHNPTQDFSAPTWPTNPRGEPDGDAPAAGDG
jgi:hypothetical protein